MQQQLNLNTDNLIEETIKDADIFEGQDLKSDDFFNQGSENLSFDNSDGMEQNQHAQFNNQNETTSINVGQAVKAEFVIGMLDNAAPPLIKILLSFAGYKDVKVATLKMSAGDKKFLEQPTQNYLNTIDIKLTPLQGFLTALGSVYATKVVSIISSETRAEESEIDTQDLNNLNAQPKRTRAKRSDAGKKRVIN